MAKKIKFTPSQNSYVFGTLKRGLRKELGIQCVTHLDVVNAVSAKFGVTVISLSKKAAYRSVLSEYFFGSNMEFRDFIERHGGRRKRYLEKQPKQTIVGEILKPTTTKPSAPVKEKKAEATERVWVKGRHKKIPGLTDFENKKVEYYRYLRSKVWKAKRKKLFDLRGRRCEECGFTMNLHIHHLTYKNIFNEPLEDLMILCENCHKAKHVPPK